MKKAIVTIIGLAVVSLLILLIFKRVKEKKNIKSPPTISEIQQRNGFPVEVEELVRADIEKSISVDGTVESARKAVLVSRYDRKITSIKADEGDSVDEGEILVFLENKAVELRRDAARSALDESEKDLSRAEALFDSGAISRQEMDEARVETDRLRAIWQERVEEAGDMFIASPLTGFVSRRYKEPGELSGAGDPILEIVDIEMVEVVCDVSEQAIGEIHEGQAARISIDAYPDLTWEGVITTINPTASGVSRLFSVKINLNNPGYRLRPGMYARVVIVQETHRGALLLPQEALVVDARGTKGIYQVCEGDVAQFVPVSIGIRSGGMVEVLAGLDDNCRIVIKGQDKLSNGVQVIREKDAAAAQKED